jgi:hypothetical protein
MPLRNPTTPTVGVAAGVVGAAGAAAAAANVWVVTALREVNTCAVGAALDSVTVADGSASVASASTTPTAVGVVAALTVAECVEFDSGLAGVDGNCSVSGAGVAGGVLA